MMKKQLFLLLSGVLLSWSSMAQQTDENKDKNYKHLDVKLRIGLKAGPNFANLTVDNSGSVNDRKAILSFNGGIYADILVIPVLSLQPGLFLSGKGSKFTLGDPNSLNYSQIDTRPLYLELPVNLVVKLPLVNKVKLFVGAGPYLAAGIGGKNELSGKVLGVAYSSSSKLKFSNESGNAGSPDQGNLKRMDAGINMLAGLEISHFTLNANYGYGLMNVKPGTSNNTNSKYQNRVVAIQVGVMF